MTELSIAQMALDRIHCAEALESTDDTVANITNESTTADVVKRWYARSLQRTLEGGFPWGYARRAVALTLIVEATTEPWADLWRYSYEYPADAAYLRRFITKLGDQETTPPKFAIWGYTDGDGLAQRMILTDVPEDVANMEYTANITDPGAFTATLESAVAFRLAFELLPTVGGEGGITRKELYQLWMAEIATARENDTNESAEKDVPDGSMITSRR